MERSASAQGFVFYAIILTSFFLLFEISFFITCNKAYFADFTHVAAEIHLPLTALPPILQFILIQVVLHLSFALMVWISATKIGQLLTLKPQQTFKFMIGIGVGGILATLIFNAYYYPNSKFAHLVHIIFFNHLPIDIVIPFLKWMIAGFLVLFLLALLNEYLIITTTMIIMIALTSYLFCQGILPNQTKISVDTISTQTKPNVILIGVDALRPDFLAYFGGETRAAFIDNFLEEATVFSDAITPLARTFPSWTSILSGQYPKHSGVRFNLANPVSFHLEQTLPQILQDNGYQTVYAKDETRFSNIDHYFGFDEIITSPMGLNDFVIGTFNDFPLSNLLVNTWLGEWLFPYSYGNRGVYITYEPKTFVGKLKRFLSLPRQKPLFMSVHFCLTHFPNLWSRANGRETHPIAIYQASINQVDQQIQHFFTTLRQHHLLDHAIVVLLSDHGEGLALPGDRATTAELFQDDRKVLPVSIPKFYPPSRIHENINQSEGHGTDVLGLVQNHVLLAFKIIGGSAVSLNTTKKQLVTLLDIKPTILALLGMPSDPKYQDGISLAPLITRKGNIPAFEEHHHFIESDYSPASIRTVFPEVRTVMLDGVRLFEIDPQTTRLTIKPEMEKMILASKQYADIYRHWALAYYPQGNHTKIPILINLESGEWTNNLSSGFARQSPAGRMRLALKNFYGNELSDI